MATFPEYAIIQVEGYSDGFDPGVMVSQMEKGMPKKRLRFSRVKATVDMTVKFATIEDSLAFEDWYFNTIKRIGKFEWKDCRSVPYGGTVRTVSLKDGAIGPLTPDTGDFTYSKRSLTLEYLK